MTDPINYPSNSHKKKDEKGQTEAAPAARFEKVVTGEVTTRPPSTFRRFFASFKGDDVRTVREYVIFDVLIPGAKNILADVAKETIERALFGDARPRVKSSPGYQTPYSSLFKSKPREDRQEISVKSRATHNFDDLVLADRAQAQDVLDKLGQAIEHYDSATVADLYDLVGITKSFADEKWGWTDLRGSMISRTREGGYLLRLPQTVPLD